MKEELTVNGHAARVVLVAIVSSAANTKQLVGEWVKTASVVLAFQSAWEPNIARTVSVNGFQI